MIARLRDKRLRETDGIFFEEFKQLRVSDDTSPLLDRSIHTVIDRLTEIQRVDDCKPDKLENREINFSEVYDQISSMCREKRVHATASTWNRTRKVHKKGSRLVYGFRS